LQLAAEAAREKKAREIVVLDLRGLADFADHFLVCHGTSNRQVVAIADAIVEALETRLGVSPGHVEGRRVADWVLLDYIDFVVHVFLEEKRSYYGLERLWGDAPTSTLDDPEEPARSAAPAPKARARTSRRRP
jgi:ribosome-associated protein